MVGANGSSLARIGQSSPIILTLVCCMVQPPASGFHDDDHGLESLKEVLQRIVRASRENLRPLKTSRIEIHPGDLYWYEVDTTLPGARTCRIYEHPKIVYQCEWKNSSTEPAASLYTGVVKQFREVLASTDWDLRTDSRKLTEFVPKDPWRNPLIQIRIGGTSRIPVIEVLVYRVDRWGA